MPLLKKIKDKKRITKGTVCHLMLLITVMIVTAGFYFSNENVRNESVIQGQHAFRPDAIETDAQQGRNYEFRIQPNKNSFCMAFFSKHISVHVYIDDRLCYALEENKGIFGRTTGSRWNFINIPENTKKIRVETHFIYSENKPCELTFYKGNALDIYSNIIRQSAFAAVISILDMLVGTFLVFFWLCFRRRANLKKDALFFGVFAIIMGAWNFCETSLSSLFLTNRMVVSMGVYMLIMLMIIPFIGFARSHLNLPGKRFANAICMLSILNFYINMGLQLFGILDLRETVRQTHVLMCLAVGYILYGILYRIWKDGWNRRVVWDLFGIAMLAFSFYVDLNAYNSGAGHTDKIGYLGFFYYICLLTMEVVEESVKAMDDSHKAQIYREMALKDMLTALYNRNAYDQWIDTGEIEEGTGVITFDLNNLKKCNDTLGHKAGDTYIQHAAEMIRNVFEKVGRCYRIGGDEFCVIVEKTKESFLDDKLQEFKKLQNAYNDTAKFPIQIAHGYAIYHSFIDKNIEATRCRADAIMYENKKILKQQTAAKIQ